MILKFRLLFLLIVLNQLFIYADEGMWIPALLDKYKYADMQAKGLKISAEDIYSINHASLKDAVCLFGGGCTAGVISDKGLIITNHHCGYGSIQDHSSPEHDYLTDGYWSMSRDEELINKGLTVSFLIRMEDVTQKVLTGIKPDMKESEREKSISLAITAITKAAIEGTPYNASVKSFYYGNEYFLFVTEVYRDVRLVGAPPSGIGKFGGDTDNWMWPRHTGDFSLFRIYADTDNKPRDYDPSNVPFHPARSFEISMKGVKKDDFTFVYGYPAQTQEYITSYATELLASSSDLNRIKLRHKILDIMDEAMSQNAGMRIKYSAKAAGIANGWKKWIGEENGLKRLNTIRKKQEFEARFTEWINKDKSGIEKYGSLLNDFKTIYEELAPYSKARDYISDGPFQVELIRFARSYNTLVNLVEKKAEDPEIAKQIQKMKNEAVSYFKDYDAVTDQRLFIALLEIYYQDVEARFKPEILQKHYSHGFAKYAAAVYSGSFLVSQEKTLAFLNGFKRSSVKKIKKDPGYLIWSAFATLYDSVVYPEYDKLSRKALVLNRIWMKAIMEMQPEKQFYPDANQTLRIAYGKVSDYSPKDAVSYNYFTTLDGIMQKNDPEIYDYHVPQKLKDLYIKKDYGIYGEHGVMPVCFIAGNHTSGGNSGSPVLNAEGKLIGVNFDRNWEGTMSDIEYDPDQCRNIILDIRYALFIIDKFAGAGHLLTEMKIST